MKRFVLLCLVTVGITACNTEYYAKVQHFMGETVSAQELKNEIDGNSGTIIIDIRMRPLFQQDHIPGAVNIPESELYTLIDTSYPLFPIVIYGQDLARQKSAYKKVVEMGYEDVRQLYGGYSSWKYDIESGD